MKYLLFLLTTTMASGAFSQKALDQLVNSVCDCISSLEVAGKSPKVIETKFDDCYQISLEKQVDDLKDEGFDPNSSADMNEFMSRVQTVCPDDLLGLFQEKQRSEEIFDGLTEMVCECLDEKRLNNCVKEILSEQTEVIKPYYDVSDVKKAAFIFTMEASQALIDDCEKALDELGVNDYIQYERIMGGCTEIISGKYVYNQGYGGDVMVEFKGDEYIEYNANGGIDEHHRMNWDGCLANLTLIGGETQNAEVGEEFVIKVKRASDEGFVAFVGKPEFARLVEYVRYSDEDPGPELSYEEFSAKFTDQICTCRKGKNSYWYGGVDECIERVYKTNVREIDRFYENHLFAEIFFEADMRIDLVGICGQVSTWEQKPGTEEIVEKHVTEICECTESGKLMDCIRAQIENNQVISEHYEGKAKEVAGKFHYDLLSELSTTCPAAIGALDDFDFKSMNCSEPIEGKYERKNWIGMTKKVEFTSDRYIEYDDDNKLTASFYLVWEGCGFVALLEEGDGDHVIWGEIKGVSNDGFVALKLTNLFGSYTVLPTFFKKEE